MKIKVGGKYRRVKARIIDHECFINQGVFVEKVAGDEVRFQRKLHNGKWDGGCCQTLVKFCENFRPINIQMVNK